MKKTVALVAGGYSGEYAISVKTASTIEANIDSNLYDVYKIVITKDAWVHTTDNGEVVNVDKNDFSITINGNKIKFDIAFTAIHGTPGEDGMLQGYFEMLGIKYTGCDSITSALTFNKIYCNRVIEAAQVVNVAKSIQIVKSNALSTAQVLEKVSLPVFVKPSEGGSSLGTSKVKEANELQKAMDAALACDDKIMVEEFISGRELTIGVYNFNGELNALPITEVKTNNEFFDFQAKYQGASTEITPAEVSPEVASWVGETAKKIYTLLNCKGVVRIDFIYDESQNKLSILEVNTMPGQSEASIVPQQVKAAGMNLKDFYGSLLADALR